MYSILAIAAIAPLAYAAYTPPTQATFGALLTPDLSSPVTQGETYTVTWDATGHEKSTVSLVLCRGGSSNCVNDPTAIVEKIPASKESYSWAVPCSLPVGTQATSTGYGMLIIEDGTGIFQYSTQFSVLEGETCGSASPSSKDDKPTKTGDVPTPDGTHPAGHNGTLEETGPGKNSTWATASGEVGGDKTATPKPTVIATQSGATGLVQTATSTSAQWTTATQATSAGATPATQTELSGAKRNGVAMVFLGAVGAAFLL